MMINGIDLKIETNNPKSLEIATRIIKTIWTNAVCDDATDGHRYPSFDEIPFPEIREIFVYKNEKFAALWESKGAVKKALNKMIYLIQDDDALFVVFDDETRKMNIIVQAIKNGLIQGANP